MGENLTEGIIEQMEKRHEAERTLNELAAGKQKALKKQLAETEEQLVETKGQLDEAQMKIKKLMEELKKKK